MDLAAGGTQRQRAHRKPLGLDATARRRSRSRLVLATVPDERDPQPRQSHGERLARGLRSRTPGPAYEHLRVHDERSLRGHRTRGQPPRRRRCSPPKTGRTYRGHRARDERNPKAPPLSYRRDLRHGKPRGRRSDRLHLHHGCPEGRGAPQRDQRNRRETLELRGSADLRRDARRDVGRPSAELGSARRELPDDLQDPGHDAIPHHGRHPRRRGLRDLQHPQYDREPKTQGGRDPPFHGLRRRRRPPTFPNAGPLPRRRRRDPRHGFRICRL